MKLCKLLIVALIAWLAQTALAQSENSTGPAPDGGAKFPWPDAMGQPSDKVPAARTAPGTPTKGSLAIRAVQGTPGGPPIGSVPVEIELQHQGMVVDTIKSQLDEHGVLVLDDLPIEFGVLPVARVQYQTLTYQVGGEMMDLAHPQQQLDVPCYEPTVEKPNWNVQMMHFMIAEVPAGLQVTEVIVIDNPAERTWLGSPRDKSKPVTTAFTLPEGAKDVTLGRGFHKWCCSTLAGNLLMNHLPLMPDTTEMVFSYIVPVRNGQASIDITAPAPVQHMMVLVPDSMKTESFKTIELGGTQTMGDSTARYYMASNFAEGERANITLSGLRNTAPTSVATGAESVSKVIAAIGGAMIVILAITLILLKGGKREQGLGVGVQGLERAAAEDLNQASPPKNAAPLTTNH